MALSEPLSLSEAAKLAKDIVLNGTVNFTKHCIEQMKARGMTAVDCENVARGGWCRLYDFIGGTYRYQMTTHHMAVVIAFFDETELVFITCWRLK